MRRLQAATEVAIAVGGETDLSGCWRRSSSADGRWSRQGVIILLREGDELVVAATAAVAGGLDPEVAESQVRVAEGSEEIFLGKFTGADLGAREAGRALIAPLLFRGQSLGLVVALDRVGDPGHFDEEHQRMLESFAASAATGVATARSMAEERLQNTIDAAEQERGRWARELHDETLQSLAVLRMRLASALRDESPDDLHETGQEAVQQIDDEIVKLRRLITELRPASLDTIGLEAALYALSQQHRQAGQIRIESDFELPREAGGRPPALLETAVYRLVQEALNNVSKHSMARQRGAQGPGVGRPHRDRGLRRRRRLRAESGAGGLWARRDARTGDAARRHAEDRLEARIGNYGSGGDPAQRRTETQP